MLSFVMALVIIVHVIIRGGCFFIFIGFDVNITVFYTTYNVTLISFNIVGKVLIVSSVPWSLSKSFEFKHWGVASCVLESA